jgi:hypothetical protein
LTSKSNSKNNNTVMCMGNYRQSFIGDWIYWPLQHTTHDST